MIFIHALARRLALDRFDEQTADKRRRAMISRCYLIPVDEEIAVQGARFRHERDWGLGDALIYATAIREGAEVLTGDHHFKGLRDVIFLGGLAPPLGAIFNPSRLKSRP